MPGDSPQDEDAKRQRVEELLQRLSGAFDEAVLNEARDLVLELRNLRDYEPMGRLAEAVSRVAPEDARNRRLYAQSLIETGKVTVAIDVLRVLRQTLDDRHPESIEAAGLLGRAHKQLFFDAADKTGATASRALAAAIEAYRGPFESDPKNTWHGINLLALLSRARREGWADGAPDLKTAALAGTLFTTLMSLPAQEQDAWHLPTLAEVALGLSLAGGDLGFVERQLREYVAAPNVQAFQVASTLRQFTEVWGLDQLTVDTPGTGLRSAADVQRAKALTDILRARLMQLPGGELTLSAERVAAQAASAAPPAGESESAAAFPVPDRSQLEAVLGQDGPQTYAWWRAGLDAALSVGVIRQRLGKRLGTGFLVRAEDFGLADSPLLLTNYHVVNPKGIAPAVQPDMAEVIFEAQDPSRVYRVAEIVWSSPVDQHDASLLRLEDAPAGIAALRFSPELPAIPAESDESPKPRVYIVGYPGGRELSFSFQDNELLDHEGPPSGKPQIEGVCRVHYRAPTEGGNSGSPVFEDRTWQVIALHHKGGKFGMPRLNGVAGTYAANEGLAASALLAAARAALRPSSQCPVP